MLACAKRLTALKAGARAWDKQNLLEQSIQDIVHSPCTFPQMRTKSMAQIVRLCNLSQGVHPTFETTIDELTIVGDGVTSISAGSISLFSVGSVEDTVEVDQVEVGEGLVGSGFAEVVQVFGHSLHVSFHSTRTPREGRRWVGRLKGKENKRLPSCEGACEGASGASRVKMGRHEDKGEKRERAEEGVGKGGSERG